MKNICLTDYERETLSVRLDKLVQKFEKLRSRSQELKLLGASDLYYRNEELVGECQFEIGILNKILDWKPESVQTEVKPLDHAQLLREDRAFQIYVSLLNTWSHQLNSHIVAADDLAAKARDYEEEFYRTEEPSDPNLLQFEGVETVFGEFRTNGEEIWFEAHDGKEVMIANFSEQFQAIDAAQELNERLNGYPVKTERVRIPYTMTFEDRVVKDE